MLKVAFENINEIDLVEAGKKLIHLGVNKKTLKKYFWKNMYNAS